MKKSSVFLFLVYIIMGLYFINAAVGFYVISDSVLEFESFIVLIGGILLILGGINSLRIGARKHPAIPA